MHCKMISVVIPCYNSADTIGRALNSVLSQTWSKFEIIVVDDCSKDNTVETVESFLNEKVRLIKLDVNSGGSFARNVGIDHSQGDYIAFLDADDYWREDKLERQMDALTGSLVCSSVVIYSSINMVMEDRIVTRPNYAWDEAKALDEYMIVERQLLQTSGLLVSVDLARRVNFDATLRKYQDTDFILSLWQHGAKFVFAQDAHVYFESTTRPNRVSLKRDPALTVAFINKWNHLLSDLTKAFYYLCAVAPLTMSTSPIDGAKLYVRWRHYVRPLWKDVIESAILYLLPHKVYSASRAIFHFAKYGFKNQ